MASRIFLLDRSGSMETCWDDTIGGYNAFIKEQAPLGGDMTLVLFDHEYTEVYTRRPMADIEPLTRETYTPRGSTALLDAIGRTIKEWNAETAPTVIILTDGLENASTKFTKVHIKDLIDVKTAEGWQFVYLGANQDAFAEARSIGIGAGHTLNFETTRTPEVFRALSAALSQQASTNSPDLNLHTQVL
jgi:hypothetical protein